MNANITYGAQFLEQLDKVAGKTVFRFAERTAFREMDQTTVAERMKPLGKDFFQTATTGTPKELAELLADKIKSSYVAETGFGTAELLSLLILD